MKRMGWTVSRFLSLGGALAIVTIFVSAFWFVASHRTSVPMSPDRADIEFARLRTRFINQEPLLDMNRRERSASTRASGPVVAPLRSFHTVIFDTRGSDRLIRIDVPYWFARRFAGGGEFTWLGQLTFLDDTEFDPEPIRLSLAQIERRGPGLVADYGHPAGGQFISWVE